MFTFLLVVQGIIAFVLVTVILMQRSEGGGLGMGGGGGPSGLMSARGAADFMTRLTTILASAFVGMSIILAVLAATQHRAASVDTSLVGKTTTSEPAAPAPPAEGDALSGAAAAASGDAQAPATQNQAVPLAQ
ncbi:MAG: preprotein translocase subunit SecG [Sphingobium sp. 66-54]|nr:MAG: preprotein translocase subunit SecG [Sphingobium sp. 66-54]